MSPQKSYGTKERVFFYGGIPSILLQFFFPNKQFLHTNTRTQRDITRVISHATELSFVGNENFKVDFALFLLAVSFDVDEVRRPTDNLDQDILDDAFELDEHQRRHVVRLTDERKEMFLDHTEIPFRGKVGDLANVVPIGDVFAFAFDEDFITAINNFRHEFVDTVHLDSNARLAVAVSIVIWRAALDKSWDS